MNKSDYKFLLERYKEKSEAIAKATIDTIIKETPKEKEARIKHLLKPENYAEFFDYYFGAESNVPLADCLSAQFHVDIYKDLYYNDFITIGNFVFRGGAKSTHGNLGYPFALKQAGKAHFFVIVGANETRAFMLLQDLQIQLENNQRIINDFGEQKTNGSWADGKFETTDHCTFMALGIDQPMRGLRANGIRVEYVSVDDVEDAKRAMNHELCNEYADKITGDLQAAFSINSERTIINNNYFVENGFIGEIMKRKGIDMRKIDTRHNNIIKHKRVHVYQINLTDKYYPQISADKDDWKPSWDRFSREYCLRKVEDYKYDQATLSNEYYNTPVKVGRLFKPEMIRWVKPLPLNKYALIVSHWDLSYKAKADTKAMALIGCIGSNLVLLDIFCRNCDIDTAMQYHFAKSDEIVRKNPSYLPFYDANVAQETIYEPVWAEAALIYHSSNIPLPSHNTTDKFIKITTILGAAFMNGTLQFSEKIKENPDWEEASYQLFGFEKGSRIHDDFPDALAEAVGQAKANYSFERIKNFKPVIGKHKRSKTY